MKTIFIPIFQGVEARNILRTDIFKILQQQKDLQIVLFVPNERKKQYFSGEFPGENVIFEVFDNYKTPSFNWLFTFLKLTLIKTDTMDALRKLWLSEDKNYFKYYLRLVVNRLFARRFFRSIVRWLDWKLVKDDNFKEFFNKYNPDLVFLAHLFGDDEASLLRQARKRKIKTVGIINSWDKITSRCMVRLLPDKLIVHNNIMQHEAVKYVDMPKDDIIITGIPHYDIYVNQKPSRKEDFYKKLGADVNKKLLFFCPLGKRYSDVDIEVLNIISGFQVKKLIPHDVQIVVRFPPNDIIDTANIKNKNILIFNQPGKRFSAGNSRRVDWDMDDKEIQHLFNSLFYMSLIVCHASSLSIDSSFFNKPIINYCLESNKKTSLIRNPNWMYGLTHYQPILKSNGVKVVKSKNELLEWVNKYLDNPEIDSEGRRKIVEEQCWKLDGKAGERAARFLLTFIYGG